ncbi:mandelate racemase/muconate lactonizing enzyme family protein [Dysosmobacter welbionis]|uniref:mandelate racemase/muconate lactonizing enzyme family protein n=1 Tax=Dysosmobacter welbionis TaxID=2093857 RepID=UPI0032C123A0
MKITSVDVFDFAKCLQYEDCAPICIRVNTDAGISGFGEVGLAYGNAHYAGVGIVRDFGQLIIGMDPLNSEKIREKLFRQTFWGMGGGTVISSGLSAIDIALWDIKGKYYQVPVYQMLGGRTNEKLRAYASQIQFDWDLEDACLSQPEEYAEAARKAISQGYTAVKVDPIGFSASGVWQRTVKSPEWRTMGQLPKNVLEMVRARLKAIRDASDTLDIIIELHAFTDTSTAIQLANYVDDLGIMYYEEPVHPLNAVSMREIKSNIKIPVASGERIYGRLGFRPFFESRALDIIQPDVCNCGGISEVKKICDMADVYDMKVQIHVCGGPISQAAALHVETAIPNFIIHEQHSYGLKEGLINTCKYDYRPDKEGNLAVPELPGIGQEITEETMQKTLVYTIQ